MPGLLSPLRLPNPYPEMDSGQWNTYQILQNFQYLTGQLSAVRSALGGGTWTNPMTALGDLVRGLSGGLPVALPIGTTGQVLTVATGVPVWETYTVPEAGLTFAAGTAPGTPAAGTGVLYLLAADKKLYLKDDTGTATALF